MSYAQKIKKLMKAYDEEEYERDFVENNDEIEEDIEHEQ